MIRIDSDRLWAALMHSARIGQSGETGLNRQALSASDRDIRDWFCARAIQLGCQVATDRFGNIFARKSGSDPTLAPLAIGSHLDTQPSGGRFDGILGVLAGLEILAALNDAGVTLRHPLEVIDWTNEEGSRFTPAMLGSGGYAGVFSDDYVDQRQDREGITFADALAQVGYRGDAVRHKLAGYLELHIEQGPILEAEQREIGVVTGVQAISWFNVVIEGDCCHAGTTPMALRRDPVPALAALLAAIDRIGNSDPGRSLATVGIIETRPGSRNTVPQAVQLTVDLRHPEDDRLAAMSAELQRVGAALETSHRVRCQIDQSWNSPAVRFDETLSNAVRQAAIDQGLSWREMVSGAGHDAVYVAKVAPTAMIFVPCLDGISHNPRESITPRQAATGATVLLQSLLTLDRGAQS